MISFENIVTTVAVLIAGWILYRVWKHLRRAAPVEVEVRLLADSPVRMSLSDFLARHQIVGDANIRDGKVYAVVPPERLHPLVRLLRGSFSAMTQVPNAVNGDLYQAVKNPGQGTGWTYRCSGVGVSDIGEAASLLEQAAARETRDEHGVGG